MNMPLHRAVTMLHDLKLSDRTKPGHARTALPLCQCKMLKVVHLLFTVHLGRGRQVVDSSSGKRRACGGHFTWEEEDTGHQRGNTPRRCWSLRLSLKVGSLVKVSTMLCLTVISARSTRGCFSHTYMPSKRR